jgi:hypothetical protein
MSIRREEGLSQDGYIKKKLQKRKKKGSHANLVLKGRTQILKTTNKRYKKKISFHG